MILFLLITGLGSCTVKPISTIEVVSPEQNPYWGRQVVIRMNDTVAVDTSFYLDLTLQPFVDPIHFQKNKKVVPDLLFPHPQREQFRWLNELDVKQITRLNRLSRKSRCICYQYDLILPEKTIAIYVPEDTSCYHAKIARDLANLSSLFIFVSDSSYAQAYSK